MDKFSFNKEWFQLIDALPAEMQTKMYAAIMQYAFCEQEPTDETIKMLTALIRISIDNENQSITQKKQNQVGS